MNGILLWTPVQVEIVVLLGEGIPLFTQKAALKRFRLEGVRQYGQFAELVYGRL